MLHEILLSLSGLQSPVWNQAKSSADAEGEVFNQYVSPPERAMLDTLGHLHDIHVKVRDAATRSATHPSVVCRAVGSSIADVHLGRFMDKIMEVESLILKKDAGYVGAYEIVPLSTIISEFAPWTRRLEWLWSLVQHLDPRSSIAGAKRKASGANILDVLEKETHTGYSDIEDMAIALLEVAQRTWMRAASLWALYGKLPAACAVDFCIKANPTSSSTMDAFSIDPLLVPEFVNSRAAHALLSSGSALNQLRSQNLYTSATLKGTDDPSLRLMPVHMRLLQTLHYPLNPLLLENVLSSINQSISENALSQILPRHLVMQLLQITLRYMLLDHGEFAVALVAHADERVNNLQHRRPVTRPVRKIGRLDDLTIPEVELNDILNKAMADLSALQADDDLDDDIGALARKLFSLRPADISHGPRLIATLLPTPTSLHITIPPSSPLHIFLSGQDTQSYALVNAYLLSIRRAGLHLSDLWKLSYHRRCYPTPLGPPKSASAMGPSSLANRRARDAVRSRRTRPHWTCASKALYLINALQTFFHGEVIQSSWANFHRWIDGEGTAATPSARSSRPGTASSAGATRITETSNERPNTAESTRRQGHHDPRALAEAHRLYLHALTDALFLANDKFMTTLKSLLHRLDHFVALFSRVQTVWEGLDLQEDDGVLDAFANHARDERDVLAEMDRTRDDVEATLVELVGIIRGIEEEKRSGSSIVNTMSGLELNGTKFIPWQARTVDRLVMKLDSLTGRREENEEGSGSGIADVYHDE